MTNLLLEGIFQFSGFLKLYCIQVTLRFFTWFTLVISSEVYFFFSFSWLTKFSYFSFKKDGIIFHFTVINHTFWNFYSKMSNPSNIFNFFYQLPKLSSIYEGDFNMINF